MMQARSDIFHADFKATPYWWEAYRPVTGDLVDVPRTARVAIVGGGYAGLSCAIELADAGIEACVLEAAELGAGASTRSGGAVSGGVNIGKSFTGKVISREPEVLQRILASGNDAFSLIESLIAREGINCHWEKTGRFVGAWTPKDFRYQEQRLAALNANAASGAYMVPKERQREEMDSDYYYGGMVVERSAKLHPALYYKGLLDAARKRAITMCAKAAVRTIKPAGKGWRIETSRGQIEAGDIVIATNGYTGDATPQLARRLIPLASHIIATEELPDGLARSLIPKGRTLSDTKRVLCYYRMSPDGRRMVFGGRARFTQVTPEVSAPVLYRFMTERFPQLKGFKVTHAWTGNVAFTFDALPHTGVLDGMHYALGCNGSGVAMMTYLGRETARRIIGGSNTTCGFELEEFPDFPMYNGKPDWALPAIGAWYRFRDSLDRALAR
jgi:glycine/D-amino acid oxidase-like deaminating enzyme